MPTMTGPHPDNSRLRGWRCSATYFSAAPLEELDRIKLLFWVVGGHWITSNARLDREGEASSDSETPPQIAVHTTHRYLDGRITLDPVTNRPSTLDFAGHRQLDLSRDEHWKFDDFQRVDGCWLPKSIIRQFVLVD